MQVLALPVRRDLEGRVQRYLVLLARVHAADDAKAPDYRRVTESVAGVFATLDFRTEVVFRNREKNIHGRHAPLAPDVDGGQIPDVDREIDQVLVRGIPGGLQHYRRGRLRRRVSDLARGASDVVTDELGPPIHHHLRRVNAVDLECLRVIVLPRTELRR